MDQSNQKSSDQENDSPSEKPSQDNAEPSSVENSSAVSSENKTPENQEVEVTETKAAAPEEPKPKIPAEEEQVKVSENIEITGNLSHINPKPPVVLAYETREKQKSHVYGKINQRQTRQNIPPPPSYYPSRTPARNQPEPQNQDIKFNRFNTPQPNDLNFGQMFINPAYWCPYPTTVPPKTPPCLAHLVETDALFVIRNFEILELLTGYSQPDTFLIQNKNGECLYYAYEISRYSTECCDSNRRGVQLVIKDLYQNEVIFMNKFCGCNVPCFFCCYPIMEVYAPPSDPVGAVIRVCESSRDDYLIIDADENKMFKIYGSVAGNLFPSCTELEYSIHALDHAQTKVGHIKRQYGDFRTYSMNAEVSGISFPQDTDVRIKSVFLGALLLIEITYFS